VEVISGSDKIGMSLGLDWVRDEEGVLSGW
jgi:hypothetical protein